MRPKKVDWLDSKRFADDYSDDEPAGGGGMRMYLITYWHKHRGFESGGFHYDISESVEKWIDETQQYDDDLYILINALQISEEQAKKWEGALHSM